MIGDRAREVIANARNFTWPTRMIVNLKGKPLKFMDSPDTNPDVVSTYGNYYLVYRRKTRNGNDNVKRFAIIFDFGNKFLKFSNYNELKLQAETNDIAKFALTYTNLRKEMFNIAVQNESMRIPVSLDVVKYNRDIRKQLGNESYAKYEMVFNPFKPKWNSTWDVNENNEIYYKEIDLGNGSENKDTEIESEDNE